MSVNEKMTRPIAPEVSDPTTGREKAGYDKLPSAPPAPVYDKLRPTQTPPPTTSPATPPTDKK